MRALIFTLLFLSFDLYAACFPELPPLNNGYWCSMCWSAPVQREDGTPLKLTELTDYVVETNHTTPTWHPFKGNLINTSTGVYWWSSIQCPKCDQIRIQSIDLEGSASKYAYQSCPPETPVVCK